jgi:hypothetical protein
MQKIKCDLRDVRYQLSPWRSVTVTQLVKSSQILKHFTGHHRLYKRSPVDFNLSN